MSVLRSGCFIEASRVGLLLASHVLRCLEGAAKRRNTPDNPTEKESADKDEVTESS